MVDEISPAETDPSLRTGAEQALYKRLVISHFDLMEARRYLERLLGNNGETAPLPGDKIQREALITALIVSYGRPFSGNRAGEKVRASPPERFLRAFSSEELRLHQDLLQLRNREFAHSDPDPSAVEVDVLATREGLPTAMPMSNRVRIGLGEHELRILSHMITLLYGQIYDEMRRIEAGFLPGESF